MPFALTGGNRKLVRAGHCNLGWGWGWGAMIGLLLVCTVRPHPPHAVCTGSETQGAAAHIAGGGRLVAFALSRGWLEDLETAACSA